MLCLFKEIVVKLWVFLFLFNLKNTVDIFLRTRTDYCESVYNVQSNAVIF